MSSSQLFSLTARWARLSFGIVLSGVFTALAITVICLVGTKTFSPWAMLGVLPLCLFAFMFYHVGCIGHAPNLRFWQALGREGVDHGIESSRGAPKR